MDNPLDYLIRTLGLEETQKQLSEGVIAEDLADAVRQMELRGELVEKEAWGKDDIKPADYSDAGNAAVFSACFGQRLLYTDSRGWLAWDGMVWRQGDHQAVAWAVELTEAMLE